jgi:NAD(P)-dependent dehydrogenase (short-subunit alcohol dehydrogenase family)
MAAANKGIGFEIARILAQQGLHTIVTARDGGYGLAAAVCQSYVSLKHLQQLPHSCFSLQLQTCACEPCQLHHLLEWPVSAKLHSVTV